MCVCLKGCAKTPNDGSSANQLVLLQGFHHGHDADSSCVRWEAVEKESINIWKQLSCCTVNLQSVRVSRLRMDCTFGSNNVDTQALYNVQVTRSLKLFCMYIHIGPVSIFDCFFSCIIHKQHCDFLGSESKHVKHEHAHMWPVWCV